ncbi:MAG TPA: hypothetical protein VFT74_19735 [Isosphaeraceae bacterium]|nr:hypothetical protein [Isosphaeraceae bacterium]
MTQSLILERHNATLTSRVPIPDDLLEFVRELDGRVVEGEPNWGGPDTRRIKIASAKQWELFLDELAALERIARNTDATDAYYDEIMASLNDR